MDKAEAQSAPVAVFAFADAPKESQNPSIRAELADVIEQNGLCSQAATVSERWDPNPAEPAELASARVHHELQTDMASFSTGRLKILDGGHVLPITRPQKVSEAILETLAKARNVNAARQ